MKTFTIDSENNITVFASYKDAKTSEQEGAVIFTTEEELAKLAAHWPTHRLVDIWNSLTGVTPVRKFTDRKTAIARIWKAIQSLQPAATSEAQEEAAPSRDVGTGRAAESKASRKAKGRKPVPSKAEGKAAPDSQGAREGSKKVAILELLRQPNGATLKDLMAATGWQAHSVRGFISGAIVKKMGLTVDSEKRPDGERAYRMAAQ